MDKSNPLGEYLICGQQIFLHRTCLRIAIGRKKGKTVYCNFYITKVIPETKRYASRCIVRNELADGMDGHVAPHEFEIPQDWILSGMHKYNLWGKYPPQPSEYIGDPSGMEYSKWLSQIIESEKNTLRVEN